MGFQSTALIYSSIPEGEIKRIDRPSALWCHSSPQLYVKLKTQLKFKLFQSEAAPQPMFHLIELLIENLMLAFNHKSKWERWGKKRRHPFA